MSFKDDIQTIAKTKILEDGVAKARAEAAAAKKEAIDSLRSLSYKGPNSNASSVSGAPGGGDSVEGNTPGSVLPPGTTPLVSQVPSVGNGLLIDTGVHNPNTKSPPPSTVQTDLSDKVGTGGLGGSEILELSQYGANNATITSQYAAIDANTSLSTAEKTNAKWKLLRAGQDGSILGMEQGVFHARDLLDDASFVPRVGDQLQGIVGFDEGLLSLAGSVLGVLVSLTGRYHTPIDADASAKGQDSWTLWDNPPIEHTYTAGSIWKLIYGSNAYFGQTLSALTAAALAGSGTLVKAYGYTVATGIITGDPEPGLGLLLSGNPNGVPGVTSVGSLGGASYGYVTSGIIGSGYGQVVCGGAYATGGGVATCALPTPYESKWPSMGAYILTNYIFGVTGTLVDLAGKFVASTFDPDIPQKYYDGVNIIDVLAGDGVNIVDTRKLRVETISGGFLTYNADGVTGSYKLYGPTGVLKGVGPIADRQLFTNRW